MLWYEKADYDRALADCNEVIRLTPNNADLYADRGVLWFQKHQDEKALTDFNEAIRLDPNCAKAYGNRAVCWANSADPKYRDLQKAVESAKRACELTSWKNAGDLANLADICAAAGQIADSLKYQKQAEECSRRNQPGGGAQ
jgi:Tfp pilus assembly protein PilF